MKGIKKMLIDLTGKRFGKLTVAKRAAIRGGEAKWECLCDCGAIIIRKSSNLREGSATACFDCRFLRKHRTTTYFIWQNMKARCLKSSAPAFHRYGGRGITICDKWLSFAGFYEDMGDRPPGKQLDRIDNNGPYCKENCRWTTPKENAANCSHTIFYSVDGITLCQSDWCKRIGRNPGYLSWCKSSGKNPIDVIRKAMPNAR